MGVMAVSVRDLYLYPLKSAAGIRVSAIDLDAFGFAGDRRWMIVDPDGRFLSQRELPRLALVRARLEGSHLRLDMGHDSTSDRLLDEPRRSMLDDLATLVVETPAVGARVPVTVWDDTCEAIEAPPETRTWLRDALGVDCRLVYAPDDMRRLVDRVYAHGDEEVGFADGFPLLVIGESSLDDLNERLLAKGAHAVPMNRFRPNIVVTGSEPYAEDTWHRLTVGQPDPVVHLEVVKPCARCVTVTVDQSTGVQGKEPLTTLSSYRRRDGKVFFGQNVIHRSRGTIAIGDPVQVIASR
jgi:uncharacterized protein YcbX